MLTMGLLHCTTRTVAYSLVTPCGISIGVGVRKTFQPNDPSTILTIGILDSISAGVLLYGALVDMIANDFLHGEMLEASTPRIWIALISVLIGAIIMSIRKFPLFRFFV